MNNSAEVSERLEQIKKRLAHTIWDMLQEGDIPNTSEGNWRAAEGIMNRVLNGVEVLEDYRQFFDLDDYRFIEGRAYERARQRAVEDNDE